MENIEEDTVGYEEENYTTPDPLLFCSGDDLAQDDVEDILPTFGGLSLDDSEDSSEDEDIDDPCADELIVTLFADDPSKWNLPLETLPRIKASFQKCPAKLTPFYTMDSLAALPADSRPKEIIRLLVQCDQHAVYDHEFVERDFRLDFDQCAEVPPLVCGTVALELLGSLSMLQDKVVIVASWRRLWRDELEKLVVFYKLMKRLND